jgi:hypothetical protein
MAHAVQLPALIVASLRAQHLHHSVSLQGGLRRRVTFQLTEELYFDYVIRFRGNISVTAATGETRTAADWVQTGGRTRVLRGAPRSPLIATRWEL